MLLRFRSSSFTSFVFFLNRSDMLPRSSALPKLLYD